MQRARMQEVAACTHTHDPYDLERTTFPRRPPCTDQAFESRHKIERVRHTQIHEQPVNINSPGDDVPHASCSSSANPAAAATSSATLAQRLRPSTPSPMQQGSPAESNLPDALTQAHTLTQVFSFLRSWVKFFLPTLRRGLSERPSQKKGRILPTTLFPQSS